MFVYFTTVIEARSFLRETEKPSLNLFGKGFKPFKKIYMNLGNYSSSRECSSLFISMITSLSLDDIILDVILYCERVNFKGNTSRSFSCFYIYLRTKYYCYISRYNDVPRTLYYFLESRALYFKIPSVIILSNIRSRLLFFFIRKTLGLYQNIILRVLTYRISVRAYF